MTDRAQVSESLSTLLGQQLREELLRAAPVTRKGRARALERRAVERLQDGKAFAARRTGCH